MTVIRIPKARVLGLLTCRLIPGTIIVDSDELRHSFPKRFFRKGLAAPKMSLWALRLGVIYRVRKSIENASGWLNSTTYIIIVVATDHTICESVAFLAHLGEVKDIALKAKKKDFREPIFQVSHLKAQQSSGLPCGKLMQKPQETVQSYIIDRLVFRGHRFGQVVWPDVIVLVQNYKLVAKRIWKSS